MSDSQPLMQRYLLMIGEAMSKMGERAEWMRVFRRAKTDFQRICFLLQAIKSSSKAVFYARSPEQIALAFARRCNILYNLGLINEAIADGEFALTLPCSKEEIVHIHVCLGECFKTLSKFAEARGHFEDAIAIQTQTEDTGFSELLLRAHQGLRQCEEEGAEHELEIFQPSWQIFRPKAPQLVEEEKTVALSKDDWIEADLGETPGRLVSSPKGLLRLKHTGSMSGWTVELRKNASVGEVLMAEKPYAISLSSERTKYCYSCYRRCHNLIPCENCTHVGFCSSECANDAVKAGKQATEGKDGQQHIYDCRGLLPCILIKSDGDFAHAAFKCIANTNPECLLNYICSTGNYEVGMGHQAFVGEKKVRSNPPSVLDPSDYSSVAWLTACSERQKENSLWIYTSNALYLTCCLYFAGYPMKWFDEAEENMDLFFSTPSPSNYPNGIPASWIAACMLFHIQSTAVNSFGFYDPILKTQDAFVRSENSFGRCIYPTISLINHSCYPNVAICFTDRGVAFLFALRSIPAGSEIFLSYGPTFTTADIGERQSTLSQNFLFKCNCEACKNDWKNPKGKLELVKCCTCKRYYQEDDKATWTVEDLKIAANHVDDAYSILVHPSETLCNAETFCGMLLSLMHGNRTIEPWTSVVEKKSNFEE
ncbi:hypothetical protein Aperf_G00000084315 [Anoplocephala perfoliata]